jgi:hypothetical protein
MDHGNGQKRIEARCNTFPPDDQAAVFFLEPGKRPLGLEAWHGLFDRSPTVFLGLPDPFRNLPPDAPTPEVLAEGFGIIPFICGEDFEAFPRSATFARAEREGIKQGEDLCALIAIGGRRESG